MKGPLLVYGQDNGYCRIFAISSAEHLKWQDAMADAETVEEEENLIKQLEATEIKVTAHEVGYVPDYVVQLSKIYGFEVESI